MSEELERARRDSENWRSLQDFSPIQHEVAIRAWLEATRRAQAVMVGRCVGAFRSGYDQALDDGCDANGAYECAIEEVAALSPDPKFLARKMAEARLAGIVFCRRHNWADQDTEIAKLERELAAMGKAA